MSKFDFDLFVIGAGSGGVRAARIAAGHGARVGICESSRVGGTCVIRGCVPKKLLSYAAHFHEEFEDAAGYGWELGEAKFSWSRLIANKDREIDRLNKVYLGLLDKAGVKLFTTHGRMLILDAFDIAGWYDIEDIMFCPFGAVAAVPDIWILPTLLDRNDVFAVHEADCK